jgi:hypothetical protein
MHHNKVEGAEAKANGVAVLPQTALKELEQIGLDVDEVAEEGDPSGTGRQPPRLPRGQAPEGLVERLDEMKRS